MFNLLLLSPYTQRDASEIHPAGCIHQLLIPRYFCAESDCTWMYHPVFIHLPAEGHFGCRGSYDSRCCKRLCPCFCTNVSFYSFR